MNDGRILIVMKNGMTVIFTRDEYWFDVCNNLLRVHKNLDSVFLAPIENVEYVSVEEE